MKIICIKKGENPMDKLRVPPAPLYRDPIYDSPTDPVVIYNREEKCFWMLYTQRRATEFNIGVSTVHGTKIGVASSNDGIRWLYRGTLPNLDFEPGTNTFWAPEVIYAGGKYHMYVSYVRGVPTDWKWERHIIHYSAVNMWDWKFESVLPLSSDRVIDACVYEISQGVFKMWYKDEANHSHTYSAISEDLYHWKVLGPEVTDVPHEGPNVFEFGGVKWLITDHWNGLGVYSSDDFTVWTRKKDILDEPGSRNWDNAAGHHADIVVCNGEAYIFYFTQPDSETAPPERGLRAGVQVARLTTDGVNLYCNRDEEFELNIRIPG